MPRLAQRCTLRDTIVLVDDHSVTRGAWVDFLSKLGWRVVLATNIDSGHQAIKSELTRLRVVICADWMGGYGMNGPDLFLQRSMDLSIEQVPFVLLVSYRAAGFVEYCEDQGMYVLRRPRTPNILRDYLQLLLGTARYVPPGIVEL